MFSQYAFFFPLRYLPRGNYLRVRGDDLASFLVLVYRIAFLVYRIALLVYHIALKLSVPYSNPIPGLVYRIAQVVYRIARNSIRAIRYTSRAIWYTKNAIRYTKRGFILIFCYTVH